MDVSLNFLSINSKNHFFESVSLNFLFIIQIQRNSRARFKEPSCWQLRLLMDVSLNFLSGTKFKEACRKGFSEPLCFFGFLLLKIKKKGLAEILPTAGLL